MRAKRALPRLAAAALLVGLTTSACTEIAARTEPGEDSRQARREPFLRRHLLSGELVAERAIDVIAPDVGVRPLEIRWIVENGSPVEAGDVLVAFDNAELASGLEQQRIAVIEARTALVTAESQAESRIAQARFDLEARQADLEKASIDAAVPRELKSAEEYQRLQLELRKATTRLEDARRAVEAAGAFTGADVEIQRLALERAQAALDRLEDGIVRLQIVAPSAGIALLDTNPREDRRWGAGDVLYPGEQLATLPDLQTMMVRARLYDVDDGLVAAESPAAVILAPFPDTVIPARIRSVDPIARQWAKDTTSRIFWVTVDLEELDLARMRPGMSAKVVVSRALDAAEDPRAALAASAGQLVVPRSSLDLENPSEPRLLLADGSWRAVDLGPCDPLRCVVEAGVEEGARLGWIDSIGGGLGP